MSITDEFDDWFDEVPVVCQDGDHDFNDWLDGSPVVEQRPEDATVVVRRRSFIF